uniref:Reverse transcriptase zinc-binding domain-containing protein n=1 Tax=Cannabis sativa TaxID=3483 RepID=A0A803PIA5_CANSA
MSVSSFITEERVWNVSLLNKFFQPIDIERILFIPLSYFADTDRLIWHHTTNGSYTVKSKFHLATSMKEQHCSSTSNEHRDWWKFFWNVNLPLKIRIFAWKVFQNVLSTAAALFKKKQDFELILCVLWGIWTDRNQVVHGSVPRQHAAIVQYTIRFHEDFTRLKLHPPSDAVNSNQAAALPRSNTVQHVHNWKPPQLNGFKLNVDATTNLEQKKLGIGAIIRDHKWNGGCCVFKSCSRKL